MHRAFRPLAAFVFQHCLVENFDGHVGDAANFQFVFVFGRFEQTTVQVRHVRIAFENVLVAGLDLFAEHLKKEDVQFVKVRDFVKAHEAVGRIAFLVHQNLRFHKFEEQQAVHPRNAKAERHGFALVLVGNVHFELVNRTFEEARLVAISGLFTADDFLAAVLDFFEADDVQELRVKVLVQAIAVVRERLGKEGFWGEELVEGEKFLFFSRRGDPRLRGDDKGRRGDDSAGGFRTGLLRFARNDA